MAYKILKSKLPSDIVDYCIVPYLMPSDKDVKENYERMMEGFLSIIKFPISLDEFFPLGKEEKYICNEKTRMGLIRIICRNGVDRVEWDSDSESSDDEDMKGFRNLLTDINDFEEAIEEYSNNNIIIERLDAS